MGSHKKVSGMRFQKVNTLLSLTSKFPIKALSEERVNLGPDNKTENQLTCIHRSREYSDMKVVFPDPVLPLKMESSPRRNPRINSLSDSNRFHLIPSTSSKCAI